MTRPVTPLPHPHLHRLGQTLAEVESGVDRLTDGLTDDQLGWAPEPGRWSIGQCLDHLTVVNRAYRLRIEDALERGPAAPAAEPARFRPRVVIRPFLRLMGQESGWRLPAPRLFRPPPAPAPGSVSRFFEELHALRRLVVAASGRDLVRTRLASSESRFPRLTLGEALTLLTVHCERHVLQAWRVREHPEFPEEIA
ncbi:MAG: DinB family protein [Thermoanaerobaculia bacterium]